MTTSEPASGWDAESVLAASNEWTWVPEGAPHVSTEEYLLVAYPDYLTQHTAVRMFGSDRPAAELVDEVTAIVRGWGRDRMWWQVSDVTRPATLEAELLARGGVVEARMDVLALPLEAGLPTDGPSAGVVARRVDDEAGVRDLLTIVAEAFGDPDPTEQRVVDALAEVRRGEADESVGRVLATVDGRPASTGGWTLAGPVCRLWGGGTSESARGRGAYRAVLFERMRIARAAGATLALTHGVVETSSPILTRLGFTRYGEEREILLDLA